MTSAQYRALRERAVIGTVAPRSLIGVRGADRAGYLHGLLTNDIRSLAPGSGCYAAWLTPQGRMLTDMLVYALDDEILLDVPAALTQPTVQRLDRSLFSEDVQLSDLSQAFTSVWIHGPKAWTIVQRILPVAPELESWPEYRNARVEFRGSPVTLARVSQLGVPGFGVYVELRHAAAVQNELETSGATPLNAETIEAARIEAGYPLFGIDMTDDTIPLEAGIEDRAISFTKGCYVGQEVIVRVLHRGHGRVARKLVALRVEGGVPPRGAKVVSGDREIGWVTSAADSPRLGSIALGYVHRDFTSPGTRTAIELPSGRLAAVISERPMP